MPRSSPVEAHEQPTSSRYQLLFKIASGGAGTVYVGRRTGALGFSRLVAIKRANPEIVGDPEARRMLVREATVASRIHHAHVVSVHDVELAGDDLLLVMDYVPGATLADLLEAGPLPPRLAMKVALDAASGLAAVHALCDDDGIPLRALHRDISPENVLVGFDGGVRITDFGLARLAQTSYASATGLLDGKVAYLAPEVLDGGSFAVQSDLFSLGVVVWETLTGKRLFRGETDEETRRRLRTLPTPPVSAAAPGLPAELDEVLSRALEKSPRARHETVAAFADALEAIARRHDLCGTDAELGARVQAAIGDDKRDALSRARVSATSGRPRVDFAFVETASLALGGGDGLDDAPTALHFVGRSTPTTAWRAAPPEDPPTLPPSDPPLPSAAPASRPTSWRGPVLGAAIVAIAGGAAALRWAGRPTPPPAPAATTPVEAPPPPVATPTATPAATPTPIDTATPEDETIEPADPPARARGPLRPPAPKASATDPDSLPANPYRKKL